MAGFQINEDPKARYLLPAIVFSALPNACVVALLLHSTKRRVISGLCAAIVGLKLWYSGALFRTWVVMGSDYSRRNRDTAQQLRDGGCTVIPYYGANLQDYALAFGI
jgi:hypothetical protein